MWLLVFSFVLFVTFFFSIFQFNNNSPRGTIPNQTKSNRKAKLEMRMIIESETESVQSLWIVYFYLCHILLLFRARRTFRSTRMNFKCMSVAWFLNRFDDMSPRQFYANLRHNRCLSQSSWVQVPVPVLLLFLHGLFAVDFVYNHLRVLCIQSNVIYNIFSFGQFSSFARFDSENVNVFFLNFEWRFIVSFHP